MIHFTYNTDFFLNNEPEVAELINIVAISKGKSIDKFFYHFVSETKIQQVNNDHLKHNFVTDVITFDYSDDKTISAEAFVCPEEVLKNAKIYSQPPENEVIRVLLHAVLHVLGYDDKSKESRQEMRKQEDHFLAIFNKKHK
ncbi:MAG: endoribonuclease YbeY [Bacteroidota bacterium]|nr:MAG: endoribonuclease YbeY [Bacteroidota bacterium]